MTMHYLFDLYMQIQLPPYLSSTLGGPPRVDATVPVRQQWESDEQQKWMAQIPDQYHPGLITHLPDWQNGGRDSSSLLNHAQALFPHFHSSLDPKYKGILPPQQQQIINSNSSVPHSNLRRHYNRLPSGFERNGASFHPESLQQLQLLCNQHLWNGSSLYYWSLKILRIGLVERVWKTRIIPWLFWFSRLFCIFFLDTWKNNTMLLADQH